MLIAQISDLHLRPRGVPAYRVVETNMLAQRAVAALLALNPRPDIVIVTGDVAEHGLAGEYAVARDLLVRLPMPVYAVPGNHDRRESFREHLGHLPGVTNHPRFVQFTVETYPVRLVGLDTVIPGSAAGELCPERLAWLDEMLARERSRPTFVFMHHPPFDCGLAGMDALRLIEGADGLEAIIRDNPQVQGLACGHHHRAIETLFGGTLASVAPSLAHQVELDLGGPGRESFMVMEPPAFRVWRFDGARLVSHLAYVERHPGPYPFVADPD